MRKVSSRPNNNDNNKQVSAAENAAGVLFFRTHAGAIHTGAAVHLCSFI